MSRYIDRHDLLKERFGRFVEREQRVAIYEIPKRSGYERVPSQPKVEDLQLTLAWRWGAACKACLDVGRIEAQNTIQPLFDLEREE